MVFGLSQKKWKQCFEGLPTPLRRRDGFKVTSQSELEKNASGKPFGVGSRKWPAASFERGALKGCGIRCDAHKTS